MLREIVHTLRSKLPRSLPSLVSTALAVLLVVDASLLACQLLLAHGSMQRLDALEAGTPDPSAITPRKDIDVDALVAANLFGAPEPPPVNTDPNAVPLSASNLILTGTLALRNPKKGMTIVSNDGKSAIYKVGATLAGAVVSSIYKDRVILDRGGTVEALVMPHAKPPGGDSTGDPTEVARAPAALSEGLVPDNAGSVAEVMRAGGPVMSEAGRMRGFRIFPGKDRATFVASGLHSGDVVVAFNGAPVLDQNSLSGQQVFQSFGTAPRATLTIERNGQARDVTIDVAQAGSSMRVVPTTQRSPIQPVATAALDAATSVGDGTLD